MEKDKFVFSNLTIKKSGKTKKYFWDKTQRKSFATTTKVNTDFAKVAKKLHANSVDLLQRSWFGKLLAKHKVSLLGPSHTPVSAMAVWHAVRAILANTKMCKS